MLLLRLMVEPEMANAPVPKVTGPVMLTKPAPVWSKVIVAVPDVVSEVTETAVPDVLLMSMAPAFVSAETKKAARLSAVVGVLPMPVVAFKSTVLAVIRLVPPMAPPLAVSVTVLLVVVIGLRRSICCCEVSVTLPVATIAFGTAMPNWLVTLISPDGEVILPKPKGIAALTLIPVWASKNASPPVMSPGLRTLIDPLEMSSTLPSPRFASTRVLTRIFPPWVVLSVMVEPVLLTTPEPPATVIPPPTPVLVSEITP